VKRYIKHLMMISVFALIIASIFMNSDNNSILTPNTITKNLSIKMQFSNSSESVTLSKMTTKTVVIGGNSYPEWSMYFTSSTLDNDYQIVGASSFIYSDNNYVYVFYPQGTNLWGLKFDHDGNVMWSFKYDFGKVGLKTGIYHMNGIVDKGIISLVFEDGNGYDYNIEVDMDTGAIVKSRVIKDNVFDIFTLNDDKYYRQVYSRIFYHNFDDYKIITGANEYTIPMTSQNKFVIFTVQNKFTNGGYDYMVYITDASNGKIDKSFFFGSVSNDYFYGNFDMFKIKNGKQVYAGYIVDDSYAYIFINDGSSSDYYYNFGIIKVNRLNGNIVWVTKYRLPSVNNYNRIEFHKIIDDGSYINIYIRLTYSNNPKVGSLLIMKINKVDGSVPNNMNDIHRHGAVLITDSQSQGSVMGTFIDDNNNVFVVSSFLYNNKRIVRFTQVSQGTSDLYKISVEPLKISSSSGDSNTLVYSRIFNH